MTVCFIELVLSNTQKNTRNEWNAEYFAVKIKSPLDPAPQKLFALNIPKL